VSTPQPQIPIFELPLVLLPTERIPLHIFEERYKRMIAYCLEEEAPFGVLLRTDDGGRDIGCAANVIEVLETFDDGRLNILVEGDYRFEVAERFEDPRFPMASIATLREDPAAGPADPGPAREAFEGLLAALESDAELDEDAETAYEIAARVEIPVEPKQELLETSAEPDRLELLVRILDGLGEQVAKSRELSERARGNGHGPITGLAPPES
jgi:Lon protease-like protein